MNLVKIPRYHWLFKSRNGEIYQTKAKYPTSYIALINDPALNDFLSDTDSLKFDAYKIEESEEVTTTVVP